MLCVRVRRFESCLCRITSTGYKPERIFFGFVGAFLFLLVEAKTDIYVFYECIARRMYNFDLFFFWIDVIRCFRFLIGCLSSLYSHMLAISFYCEITIILPYKMFPLSCSCLYIIRMRHLHLAVVIEAVVYHVYGGLVENPYRMQQLRL